jgi:peptide/nickel transport system substrate-binding protein
MRRLSATLFALLIAAPAMAPAWASALKETPSLEVDVAGGKLPPVAQRVPAEPLVVNVALPGKHGGEMRMLIGRARDVRLMSTYGYARLVGYDSKLNVVPDLLKAIDVQDERIFTMTLRKGHKWSNGDPFTAEDFRYFWDDVANNKDLSPAGPSIDLLVEGEKPKVEFIDEVTVRYSWSQRNPNFLARLAAASPLYIYRPSKFLKQYHAKYADQAALQAQIQQARMRGWAQLHNRVDNLYQFDQPDLPTLEPWRIVTRPPAIRFVVERNPFFHRVDQNGLQLPYIDRVILNQSDAKLIPPKSAAGEVDLQARDLSFKDFTFLKENEKRSGYTTLLWRTAKGSQIVLLPNLNVNDPVWRKLNRDVRYRRALSLGIDREAVNQSLYYGLAVEGNNTMLPDTPLYNQANQTLWTKFQLKEANKLLDEIGLNRRGPGNLRLLPDGRPMEIIIETAGEDSEQSDVLELVAETWAKLGIKLLIKPSQRDVLYNRVFAGETVMSVFFGLENGMATPAMSPAELAPMQQVQLQWPKWGQYHETKGAQGETPDMPEAQELVALYQKWVAANTVGDRKAIWLQMLKIHAEQQFTIGIVSGVYQPIVAVKSLRGLPKEGIYNFDPGAFFGLYRPETFWLER